MFAVPFGGDGRQRLGDKRGIVMPRPQCIRAGAASMIMILCTFHVLPSLKQGSASGDDFPGLLEKQPLRTDDPKGATVNIDSVHIEVCNETIALQLQQTQRRRPHQPANECARPAVEQSEREASRSAAKATLFQGI